jgi:Peptidase family M28
MRRALLTALALIALVFVVVRTRWSLPTPAPAGAPAEQFAAGRATELQLALSKAGPRPTGSEGDARGREIARDALERAGWKVSEQAAFSCGRHGACGFVKNVVAERSGSDPSAAPVMMMAHLDSVACSPGASDDGAGVAAVLEAARALGASPMTRRPLVVLLTDGEEDGLLGAEAFRRDHPLAKRVKAVVNVDARGAHGPSAMFETSADNAWLVALLAEHLAWPITSSLFYEVYRRMPNDTDFTVARTFAHGLNFANTEGIEGYHTPLDTADRASLGTLQHHGTQVLAMTRALAAADLDAKPKGDAVWFDVLAFGIVRWPEPWSLPLAGIALALVLGQAMMMRAWSVRGMLAAPLALLLAVLASAALGFGLRVAGAVPAPWVANPLPAVLSMHLAAIAGALAATLWSKASPRTLWAGTWTLWGALALASAAVAPGASYLFTVPALVAGVAAFLPLEIACVAPVAAAAVLWMPLASPLYGAIGLGIPGAPSISTAVLVTTLAPLVAPLPRRASAAVAAGALGLALVALVVPRFSAAHPQRVNVMFVQDESRSRAFVQASWVHFPWGPAPASMVSALGGTTRVEAPAPWLAPGLATDVPRVAANPPEVVNRGGSNVTLRSHRGATTLLLETPAARGATIRAYGQVASPREGRVAFRGVPPEGIKVDVTAADGKPIELVLYDMTRGVPPDTAAARAVQARPPEAAETQDGDSTLLVVRAKL